MKIKMLFLLYLCMYIEGEGRFPYNTTLGEKKKKNTRSSPNWKQSIIQQSLHYNLLLSPRVSFAACSCHHDQKRVIRFQNQSAIDGGGPSFRRCSKHRNRNYRTLTCRTASLSSSDSLFIAAFLRFSWMYLSYSSWAFFTSSFRLHIYSGVIP